MTWDIVAIDEVSAESPMKRRMHVDTENTPPSRPNLITPSAGDVLDTLQPTFEADRSEDDDE